MKMPPARDPYALVGLPPGPPSEQQFLVRVSGMIGLCSDGSGLKTKRDVDRAVVENFWEWLRVALGADLPDTPGIRKRLEDLIEVVHCGPVKPV